MLAARLKPDEAIVEMVRFREYDRRTTAGAEVFGFTDLVHYAALVVTHETTAHPEVILMEAGHDLETRYYNYYKNALKYSVDDHISYHSFWAPIGKHLSKKKRIYFCPDGVYHRVNVNTLRDPASGKFLLEKNEIVYLLNPAQLIEQNARQRPAKRNAVLIGDPVFDTDVAAPRERTVTYHQFVSLPGTREELEAIERVLKPHAWRTKVFVRDAATEANLKTVHSPSILHLASHGFFSPDVVSLNTEARKEFLFHSGIVLTGANKSIASASTAFENDGIVTAFEVMNLNLVNTELVVLSACETGLGKVENGEGVFGLQRSFMQAGARNVLISLWKVNDEATRDLMIRFYEQLVAGENFHEALRKAQIGQSGVSPDPALWGGFVLVGNI